MKFLYFDIETTGLHRKKDKITILGAKEIEYKNKKFTPTGKYIYIEDPTSAEDFKELLEYKDTHTWCGHNLVFDVSFIHAQFDIMLPIHEDSMLIQHVIDSNRRKSLKYIATEELGLEEWDIDLNTKLGKGDREALKTYLKGDLDNGWIVMESKMRELKKCDKRLIKLYRELMIPGARAMAQMQSNGIHINVEGAKKELELFSTEVLETKTELLDLVPPKFKEINLNSSAQLAQLFDHFNFPILVQTKKGARSTSADAIHELHKEVDHPFLDLLIKYRDKTRCVTFLEKWLELEYEGRLYPSFNLTGTKTGRLSSSDPNLQQVPRNPRLRRLFTAPEGKQFVECDYSQIELRVAAHISKDPEMVAAYNRGEDLHTATARLFNDEPTSADRDKAKSMNFGLLYGMQAKSYRDYAEKGYGVTLDLKEATIVRNNFFKKYRRLPVFHKKMEKLISTKGCVYNEFGRRRLFQNAFSTNRYLQSADVRAGINYPVQSMASDMLVSCMIELHETDPTIKLVGTVHDSILLEVTNKQQLETIKRIMQSPQKMKDFGIVLDVPLIADIEGGPWGSKEWSY